MVVVGGWGWGGKGCLLALAYLTDRLLFFPFFFFAFSLLFFRENIQGKLPKQARGRVMINLCYCESFLFLYGGRQIQIKLHTISISSHISIPIVTYKPSDSVRVLNVCMYV